LFKCLKIFHATLLILITVTGVAQTLVSKPDSLRKLAKTAKEDTTKIILLNDAAAQYIMANNSEPAMQCANEALVLAKKLNYKRGLAKVYANAGSAHRLKGNYTEAVKNFLLVLKLKEEMGDKKGIASAHNYLGIVYNNQNNFEEAIKSHNKALTLRKEYGTKDEVAGSYNNIGLVYYGQSKFKEALENFAMALELTEGGSNIRLLGALYGNMANIYEEQNKFDKALTFYKAAFDIKGSGDVAAEQRYNASVGHVLMKQGKLNEAKTHMEQSLEKAKKLQSKEYIQFAYHDLEALSKKRNDFKAAYAYRVMSDIYTDSLVNRENTAKTVQMRMQYEFDKKAVADSIKNAEHEKMEQLRHEQVLHRQQTYTYGGLIGFALMLLVAITSFKAYSQKKKSHAIIAAQKHLVDEKQKEILDSIHYANRIQKALLTSEKYIERTLEKLGQNKCG